MTQRLFGSFAHESLRGNENTKICLRDPNDNAWDFFVLPGKVGSQR